MTLHSKRQIKGREPDTLVYLVGGRSIVMLIYNCIIAVANFWKAEQA